jgi:hypothetical protein
MLAGWKENQEPLPQELNQQKEKHGRLFYTGGTIENELGWYGRQLLIVTFVNNLLPMLIDTSFKLIT